ncbi:extracellular solute-binding protein [Streptomyces tsukubensis]|uniref:Sugar transporter n=1 Tax=Streptomyces tsukubensis TaxID=83656 RepID=A0A1V4A1N1_9ACTN|nr:extracellular solute-binding protein [Streptomyces tsukubensis]OON72738.1 sugar transporter [Streptomyces tsukubensis]
MKNRSIAAALALTVSLSLSGCGLVPGSGEDRRTVTVWLMKGSASSGFIKRFTDRFEHDHTDIDLDIRIQQWTGIGDKVTAVLKGEDGAETPDVIEVGNTQVAQYVDDGGLLDLTLESMRDFGMDDWIPGLADPGRFNGSQYGIPWYAANRVVIYNKDLFAKAGIERLPKTRDQWIETTERLNTGGDQGIYLAGQDWYTLSGFVWDEGGELAVDHGGAWEGALDSPAALRAMDFYRRLQKLGRGPKDADEQKPPQTGVFAKGDVAQTISVPGAGQLIEESNPELKGKLGYFPIPGRTADHLGSVVTGGSDLVVPERGDDHEGAVKVVAALAGATWQTDLARTMNYVPNKGSLSDAVAGEPGVAAMAESAGRGRATPKSPRWAAVETDNPIKRYMTEVLNGADAATAARSASEEITERLDLSHQ